MFGPSYLWADENLEARRVTEAPATGFLTAQDADDHAINAVRFQEAPEEPVVRPRLREAILSSWVFRAAAELVGIEEFLDALLDGQNAAKPPSRILLDMVEAW